MNHQQQKDRDRAEALSHYGANVTEMRGGRSHDDHKLQNYLDHLDDYAGKGMSRNPDASRNDKTSYSVKIGESC